MRTTTLLVLLLAGCARPAPQPVPIPTPAPQPVPNPVPPPNPGPSDLLFSKELTDAHNQYRASRGLTPLVQDDRLVQSAAREARDMARHHRMSHQGTDGSSPFDRMTAAGFRWSDAGENIAIWQSSVDEVMRAWEGDLPHRQNMLGNFAAMGAAAVKDDQGRLYWACDFGTEAKGMQASGSPHQFTIDQTGHASSFRMRFREVPR